MPKYLYYCEECKEIFEVMQKITDKELTSKPNCDKKDCSVVKIISRTSFVLKGDGWYRDGYSSKKKKEKKKDKK